MGNRPRRWGERGRRYRTGVQEELGGPGVVEGEVGKGRMRRAKGRGRRMQQQEGAHPLGGLGWWPTCTAKAGVHGAPAPGGPGPGAHQRVETQTPGPDAPRPRAGSPGLRGRPPSVRGLGRPQSSWPFPLPHLPVRVPGAHTPKGLTPRVPLPGLLPHADPILALQGLGLGSAPWGPRTSRPPRGGGASPPDKAGDRRGRGRRRRPQSRDPPEPP